MVSGNHTTFPDEVIGTGIVVVACDRNRRWRQRDSAYIGFSVEQKPVHILLLVILASVVCRHHQTAMALPVDYYSTESRLAAGHWVKVSKPATASTAWPEKFSKS